MESRNNAFGSAWAALFVGLAVILLSGLAVLAERAGVPASVLSFLLASAAVGGILVFGISRLSAEYAVWRTVERMVRGITAAPAVAILGLTIAAAPMIDGVATPGLLAGVLAGLMVTMVVFGPRVRQIGAISIGRMLSLRFPGWEGKVFSLVIGMMGVLVVGWQLIPVAANLAGKLQTMLGFGERSLWPALIATLMIFTPGWAGGIFALLRMARVGLMMSAAAFVSALLVSHFIAGSGTADHTAILAALVPASPDPFLNALTLVLLFPALIPVLSSLSTPPSAYRTSMGLVSIAVVGLIAVAALPQLQPGADTGSAIVRSELPAVLAGVAEITFLAIGGALMIFAVAAGLIDDIVLLAIRRHGLIAGRHLAWLRLAMIVLAGALFASHFLDSPALKMAEPAAQAVSSVFVATVFAVILPALFWSGTSGLGALAGLIAASAIQLSIMLGAPGALGFTVPSAFSICIASGVAGLAVTLLASLAVPPRPDTETLGARLSHGEDREAWDDAKDV